jgi:hypothetical protein
VADTVVVKPKGAAPEVMTNGAPKDFDKISYTLKGDDEVGAAGKLRAAAWAGKGGMEGSAAQARARLGCAELHGLQSILFPCWLQSGLLFSCRAQGESTKAVEAACRAQLPHFSQPKARWNDPPSTTGAQFFDIKFLFLARPPPPKEEEDARPEAFDDVTNGLPGKKLRSDDPNYKSAEQIRCACARVRARAHVCVCTRMCQVGTRRVAGRKCAGAAVVTFQGRARALWLWLW